MSKEHPKLFVSYSHDTNEHKEWVKKLATDLRTHGVDVILDQWDLRLGNDLRFFMEQGLSASILVLCVCSEKYVERFDTGEGGVGYESTILTQPLLTNANSDFIIPIIRNNLGNQKVPLALRSKTYINFSDDTEYYSNYLNLIKRIFNEDISQKPPLGENPFSKKYAESILTNAVLKEVDYHNPASNGTVTFDYSNNSHTYTIGNGEFSFMTQWTSCGTDCIYAYNDSVKKIGYIPNYKEFPASISDFEKFDFSSRVRTVYVNEIVVWLNDFGHFAVTQVKSVSARSHGNDKDEITFEYKIYEV